MAIQDIQSSNDLKISRENLSVLDSYIDNNLTAGSVMYFDKEKTLKVGKKVAIGVIKGSELYSVSTGDNSEILSSQLLKKRLIGWAPLNPTSDLSRVFNEIDLIITKGVKVFQLNIELNKIYTTQLQWDENSDVLWSAYDSIYNYTKDKFQYFSLQICCTINDQTFSLNAPNNENSLPSELLFQSGAVVGQNPEPFYQNSDMSMDQWGYPIRSVTGFGRPTMFKQVARRKLLSFVERVIKRYTIYMNNCISLSIPTSYDSKMGLTHVQSWDGQGYSKGGHKDGYYVIEDYHPLSQQYFKTVFMPERYKNDIKNVNDSWGKSYSSFEDIEIPKIPNVNGIAQTDLSNIISIINTNAFIDWIEHNRLGLKSFYKECKDIILQNYTSVNFCLDTISSTDILSNIKGVSNIVDFAKIFECINTYYCNFNILDKTQKDISTSIVRKTWKKEIFTSVSSPNISYGLHDSDIIYNNMFDYAKDAYKNDCTCVFFTCYNDLNIRINSVGISGVNQFQKTLLAIENINSWLETGYSFEGVEIVKTINQNLSERIKTQQQKDSEWLLDNNIKSAVNLVDDVTYLDIIEQGENLNFVQQFTQGLIGDTSYQNDKPTHIYNGVISNRLEVTVTPNYKLLLNITTSGMADSVDNMRFKVDIMKGWLTKTELEAIDFSPLKGRDIVLIMGHYPNSSTPNKAYIIHTIVHFAGDTATNLPSFIKRANADKRMPQAVYNFPNFSLPSNKKNIIQFRQLNDSFTEVSNSFLSKGFSVGYSPNDNSKNAVGIYDTWAYNNGALKWDDYPAYRTNYIATHNGAEPPFSNAHLYNVNWVETHTIQQLFSYFNPEVIAPNNTSGFVFLDYEFVAFNGLGSQDFCNKIGTLFKAFKTINPNVVFTSYVNADPVKISYDIDLSDSDVQFFNDKYTKSLAEIATGFYARTVNYMYYEGPNAGQFTGQSGNMGEFIAPVINVYLHNINENNFYSKLQEFELTSKFGFKAISFNWGLIEGLNSSDWQGYHKHFKTTFGFDYLHEVKIPIPSSYWYNMTLLSNLLGLGVWNWDEPLPFLEGFDFYGGNSRNITDTAFLPNNPYSSSGTQPFSLSQNNGSFHYASQIAYDWSFYALYRLSQNSDIISNIDTNLINPEISVDGGISYKSGTQLLPASLAKGKLPIVRLKKHLIQDQYIVFACNPSNKPWETQDLKFKIGTRIVDIKLVGQYATFERLN